MRAKLPREWNSSPPVVVAVAVPVATPVVVATIIVVATPIVIAAITSVVAKTVDVADKSQFALDLVPLRSAINPAGEAIELLAFLKHSACFIGTAIQVAAIADSRFQIAYCITESVNLVVDAIFSIGAVGPAAIEGAVHVAFEIFCQAIKSMD